MIKYEQVDSTTNTTNGSLKDVKLITDDTQAEMAALTDIFKEADAEEMQTFKNLEAATRNQTGVFEVLIPGDEVGEVSEFTWDIDGGVLEDEMERWNQQALAEAEGQGSE